MELEMAMQKVVQLVEKKDAVTARSLVLSLDGETAEGLAQEKEQMKGEGLDEDLDEVTVLQMTLQMAEGKEGL